MTRRFTPSEKLSLALGASLALIAQSASAQPPSDSCDGLPSHAELKSALTAAKAEPNGGLGLEMWAATVNRDGVVCAVVYTGKERGEQWPGSRVIAAQKAYSANAFSLPKLSISTGNLYSAVQPGGPLYGLLHTNPIDTEAAYDGSGSDFGQPDDPMVDHRVGGVNVFGGGLALYDKDKTIVGGLGVSGDTSCADHNIAWRVRHALSLDYVPGGVAPQKSHPDTIIYDISTPKGQSTGTSKGGFGHPACSPEAVKVSAGLPAVRQ